MITLKEFRNLSDEERRKRYKELSPHDLFLERIGAPNEDGSICPDYMKEELEEELAKWYKKNMEIKEKMKQRKRNDG